MRTVEEVRRVQALARSGLNHCEIARATGIPRSTIRTWLRGDLPHSARQSAKQVYTRSVPDPPAEAFAYLFGLYLGDGWLTHHPRDVYRLGIALDSQYPRIIASCVAAIRCVMPQNRVRVAKHPVHNYVNVHCYSKQWPTLFPQHGAGLKHKRRIALEQWQGRLLENQVDQLLRGLIHSDGCRAINRIKGKYEYPRYQFSNRSSDIRTIFTGACDELGIHWTQMNRYNVAVSRRADVALLDTFIGPKR